MFIAFIVSSFPLLIFTCPSPPVPLGSTFTQISGQNVTYQCEGGLRGVGDRENFCEKGQWQEPTFICASNVAVGKQTLGQDQPYNGGSRHAIDGYYYPGQSSYLCDKLDAKKKVWMVDLMEIVEVVAIRISIHIDTKIARGLEIRAGTSPDFTDNPLCWFLLSLVAGQSPLVRCSESVMARYVSISAYNLPSPLYLCEVEVLSPAAAQIALAHCGANVEKGIMVFNNMCLFINEEGKEMTFNEGKNFCEEKGMGLLHKKTENIVPVYEFVKKHLQKTSKKNRRRMYAWIGIKRGVDTKWEWTIRSSDNTSSCVSQAEWGAGEPGLVGDCAVIDSGMKWSWNAIGCHISAQVSCQGTPQQCPRPPVPEAARIDPSDEEHVQARGHWWEEGISLVLLCETGYRPSGSGSIQCRSGQWSSSSLKCVNHSCGMLAGSEETLVRYEENRTDWGAMAVVRCKEGWVGLDGVKEAKMSCNDSGWVGSIPLCYKDICGPTPEAAHSSSNLSVLNSSLVATYSCTDNTQYSLTCVAGTWQGGLPECPEETTEDQGQREPRNGFLAPRSGFLDEEQNQDQASHGPTSTLLIDGILMILLFLIVNIYNE